MTLKEEIQRAIKLYSEKMKDPDYRKPNDKIIFINDKPMWISSRHSVKLFQIEFMWLRPKALRDSLRLVQAKERRPVMYV